MASHVVVDKNAVWTFLLRSYGLNSIKNLFCKMITYISASIDYVWSCRAIDNTSLVQPNLCLLPKNNKGISLTTMRQQNIRYTRLIDERWIGVPGKRVDQMTWEMLLEMTFFSSSSGWLTGVLPFWWESSVHCRLMVLKTLLDETAELSIPFGNMKLANPGKIINIYVVLSFSFLKVNYFFSVLILVFSNHLLCHCCKIFVEVIGNFFFIIDRSFIYFNAIRLRFSWFFK